MDFDLGDLSEALDFGGFDSVDLGAFDLLDEGSALSNCAYRKPVVRRRVRCCYDRAEEFARDFTFEQGMDVFAFVSGNFIFGDFLEALVATGKVSVKRLCIQTLSMSQENIDSIRNVLDMEQPESLHMVISDYWYSHERGNLVPYMFDELDVTPEFRCAFASVHTKIILIETKRGNKLVIHGSANLRSSFNVEQFEICDDAGLYDFIAGFTDGLLAEYDVVNKDRKRKKSLRGNATWQAGANNTRP